MSGWRLTTLLAGLACWGCLRGRHPRGPVRAGWPATELAVITLIPLAAFELVVGLPVATQALQRVRQAAARVFEVLDAPAPVGRARVAGRRCRTAPLRRSRRARSGRPTRARPRPRCGASTSTLPAGRRVAVVGPSGAGKSTLASVLLRFIACQAGSVDTRRRRRSTELAGDDVRSVVGLVGQDAYLFDTTLAREPAVGKRDATDERAARRPGPGRAGRLAGRPARRAGTEVGRTGPGSPAASASGSRWPARCWPTSRCWSSTSRPSTSIRRAADALTADLLDVTDGRSLVLITHRLAGLESVDEILVLDAGRVVERGTHDELLDQGGRYAALWWDEMSRHGRPSSQTDGSRTLNTDLARWQFATTTIYHFLFVPVTIGLAFLVALLQTSWYRNDNPEFRELTRFFGTLLLINVAIGVVTGLVQEFEFGMNWSNYSRLVGNIFGGPLAMEGWSPSSSSRRSSASGSSAGTGCRRRCTWPASGWWRRRSMLSAAFIMAANSWMQHPVGYTMNAQHQPAAQQHLGVVHQPGLPVVLPARRAGLAGHRRDGHAGRLGLASAAQDMRSRPSVGRRSSPWSSWPRPSS